MTNSNAPSNDLQPTKAWVFQSSPQLYDLTEALQQISEMTWLVKQKRTELNVGDRVYLWESGSDAGVLAIGQILTEPTMLDDDPQELPFYKHQGDFEGIQLRVRIRISQVLPQRLTRTELKEHPILKDMTIIRNPKQTNFSLTNEQDQALQILIAQQPTMTLQPKSLQLKEIAPGLEKFQPEINDAIFVVIYSQDTELQQYGQSYAFTSNAGGEPRRLANALQDLESNTYLIIYRPGPDYAFTAWAKVVDIKSWQIQQSNVTQWQLTLEQHEFSHPIQLKNSQLIDKLSWLNKGLAVAFRGYSIRQISLEDATLIMNQANSDQTTKLTTMANAAAIVLSQQPQKPMHLLQIFAEAINQGLIDPKGKTPQLSLSTEMLRDSRFRNLGSNNWILAEYADTIEPLADESSINYWRVQVQPQHWESMYQYNILAFDIQNSANQSIKYLNRINLGDSIIAYFKGGKIAGIGTVTQAYTEHQSIDRRLAEDLYPQQIGVAWKDGISEPLSIQPHIQSESDLELYQRLKSPHTIAPILASDYQTIVNWMNLIDTNHSFEATRLPNVWEDLSSYHHFVLQLEDRTYSSDELWQQLQQSVQPVDYAPTNADEFVEQLRQLRLLRSEAGGFQRQAYIAAEPASLRIMALGLVVLVEGSSDSYLLPIRTILTRPAFEPALKPLDGFAPSLGADALTLLGWYAEAGLIELHEAQWQWANLTLAGSSLAIDTYNQLLETLTAEANGTLHNQLDSADGALPQSPNYSQAIQALDQELLFERHIIDRIYRSLLAGRHVILSGPPGTGKTELAKRLPQLLWQEAPFNSIQLSADPDAAPVIQSTIQRQGYYPMLVTATEDWGVRDVVGGIAPRIDQQKTLSYAIQYGHLTRAILQHYRDSNAGRNLPTQFSRHDYEINQQRYRGIWLIIDEFTRAPIDAAFGSLLTTLGGGEQAYLAVPTGDFSESQIPLPADFRIIATLNSFDRHFLNQMSEAIKRRFDFIDVLPPQRAFAEFEQAIAAKQALSKLYRNGFQQIERSGEPPSYTWPNVLVVEPTTDQQQRYQIRYLAEAAETTLAACWRIFLAIRVFRQLGTAQIITVYTNIFTSVLLGSDWEQALDTALADSLADQLQVMTYDEQKVLWLYLLNADDSQKFALEINQLKMNSSRQASLLHSLANAQLQTTGSTTLDPQHEQKKVVLTAEIVETMFLLGTSLPQLPTFRARLKSIIGQRGL